MPQKPYALKSLVIDRVSDPTFIQELQNEIDILRKLDHPNICKALETYDYEQRLYLVLELCSGGDLYSRDPYEELEAKVIVQSILEAVYYLHRKNITHRDCTFCVLVLCYVVVCCTPFICFLPALYIIRHRRRTIVFIFATPLFDSNKQTNFVLSSIIISFFLHGSCVQ